uniref:C2H2-type domain-containing protein n=1 Tax=Plectus sambesii TaxID=2011161 RepID=A0A914WSD2_9BILA
MKTRLLLTQKRSLLPRTKEIKGALDERHKLWANASLGRLAAAVESANRGRERLVDRPSNRSARARRGAPSNRRCDFRALLSAGGHGRAGVNRLSVDRRCGGLVPTEDDARVKVRGCPGPIRWPDHDQTQRCPRPQQQYPRSVDGRPFCTSDRARRFPISSTTAARCLSLSLARFPMIRPRSRTRTHAFFIIVLANLATHFLTRAFTPRAYLPQVDCSGRAASLALCRPDIAHLDYCINSGRRNTAPTQVFGLASRDRLSIGRQCAVFRRSASVRPFVSCGSCHVAASAQVMYPMRANAWSMMNAPSQPSSLLHPFFNPMFQRSWMAAAVNQTPFWLPSMAPAVEPNGKPIDLSASANPNTNALGGDVAFLMVVDGTDSMTQQMKIKLRETKSAADLAAALRSQSFQMPSGLALISCTIGSKSYHCVYCSRRNGFDVGDEIPFSSLWLTLCRVGERPDANFDSKKSAFTAKVPYGCEIVVELIQEQPIITPTSPRGREDEEQLRNERVHQVEEHLGYTSDKEMGVSGDVGGGSGPAYKGYQCERCGKMFSYSYYRDKHLKYTRCVDKGDRKFPCHLCSRSFEKRDRLRIHILHVHENHRPHSCTVCGKRFSQSSSLNKHLRVHSGERPYKCSFCTKAFTASSILRTHIRQHSGEKPFKCKFCGKAFASHAAHDSHVRRTHAAPKSEGHPCEICGKKFQHISHLKFHAQCVHGQNQAPSEENASPVISV